MISVRVKLIGLVVGSLVPAIVGAIATERATEHELLDEAGLHIKAVGRHFDELLEDYERHALLAVDFAAHDPHFDEVLARRDVAEVQKFVDQIAGAYPHHEIIATDAAGTAVAIGNLSETGDGAIDALDASSSPAFAQLLGGNRVSGLFAIHRGDATSFALVDASPVLFEGKQIGALALLTPVNGTYLDDLSKQLDANLVLNIDGNVVATTEGHPAPALRTAKEEVLFEEDHDHLFAVETFHPHKLQAHGHAIELTATRDVSELRAMARADLYRHLIVLGIPAVLVLAFALWYARRVGGGVQSMARASRRLEEGEYETVEVIDTRDELQELSESFNSMVRGLMERDRLKETFGRYVTRQVADHLMARDQELGGELVPVTVLFSDIRSFTTISESMPPGELLDFLNVYFSEMVEAVLFNGGVVDKFIGDAIMAVFGAPQPEPEDPVNAVRAALEMREKLKKINVGFAERGLPEIRIGVGLHHGQVVAGNMGHAERMEYTVIGDAVNVASRLEGMTKTLGCDIVISGELMELVKEWVEAEPLERIKVKGREEEIMVFEVIGLWHDNPMFMEGRSMSRGS